jgi:branched-chain amino acid transport system ATP-binding protein
MPILALTNIAVNFGGVRALTDLSLSVQAGSLHGLVGPNGAGKTTAMNVISGLVKPSGGSMTFQDVPFAPKPHRLAAQGLARSFQASGVVDSLSALDNVLLGGFSATRAGIVSCALRLPRAVREEWALRTRAEAALDAVAYAGGLRARMADLSAWRRRQIEIARALLSGPKLLLLDEPAAGLTASEVGSLKGLMRRLCDDAMSILLIEHNVPLVFTLCDQVTAMAQGRDIAHGTPQAVRGHADVIQSYLGAGSRHAVPTAPQSAPSQARPPQARSTVLKLQDVSAGYGATVALHGIGIEIRAGEVVALFGPNGAGKTTLLNTIIGERRAMTGTIAWQGKRIDGLPAQSIVRQGIGIVPQGRAVMERQSVEDNLVISTTGLRLGRRERQQRLDEIYTQFPSLSQRRSSHGASLSGGERQMLAIAKALIRRPALLLLDEPSIGLAPTIVDEVQRIVAELNAKGLTVLIGEQSVDWVLPIAHRAYAIAAGRIVAEGSPEALSNTEALTAQYLGAQEGVS